MVPTIVDDLYEDHRALLDYLLDRQQPSYYSTVDEHFRKMLVLSASSFFEESLKGILRAFVSRHSSSNKLVLQFVENKAISRQYHTFFDWESGNANRFFSLFGREFSAFMKGAVSADNALDVSIRAFLELGTLRNQMVHMNFAQFAMEKTAEEIYGLYVRARLFLEVLPDKLEEHVNDGS